MTEYESVCRGEIAQQLSERIGLTKKEAGEAVTAIISIMSESLVEGKTVKLVGFGNLESKKIKARKGRNPKTGQPIDIPAAVKVKFTIGKTLKNQLNENGNNQ